MDTETGFQWNKVLALSIITILPSLIVFFLAQDQFVEGISAGGVKG
jgi:oligogalacturonide transport system permease protein